MSERDDELLRRYRAAGREAPPAALDASILAASRRAVRVSPLPRWAASVSVAAVLVLALGLVLKVQREAPDAGLPVETRAAPEAKPVNPQPHAARKESAPVPVPAPLEAPADHARTLDAMPHANVAPAPSTAAGAAPSTAAAPARAPAAAAMQRSTAPEPLQRELERIARLREEGKDAEADAALAAFQREHPDHRIEPAMWDRVRHR